jgi:hypothetical protein
LASPALPVSQLVVALSAAPLGGSIRWLTTLLTALNSGSLWTKTAPSCFAVAATSASAKESLYDAFNFAALPSPFLCPLGQQGFKQALPATSAWICRSFTFCSSHRRRRS